MTVISASTSVSQLEKNYPDFNSAEFKKAVLFYINQEEKTSETVDVLSDESLKEIAGGSASGWFKRHAVELIFIGACIIGGAIWGAATSKDGNIEYTRTQGATSGAIGFGLAGTVTVLINNALIGSPQISDEE